MRYQLRKISTQAHLEYKDFDGDAPVLPPKKDLEWVPAELPAAGDPNLFDNTIIDEAPWLVTTPKEITILIANKRIDINDDFNTAIQQITAGYPSSEIASWDKQEAEARAFIADENAVTPLIDALATARGISKTDVADRIVAKADLFAATSGHLIGYRQSLEDLLDIIAADEDATADDVAAIVWDIE